MTPTLDPGAGDGESRSAEETGGQDVHEEVTRGRHAVVISYIRALGPWVTAVATVAAIVLSR